MGSTTGSSASTCSRTWAASGSTGTASSSGAEGGRSTLFGAHAVRRARGAGYARLGRVPVAGGVFGRAGDTDRGGLGNGDRVECRQRRLHLRAVGAESADRSRA